MLTYLESIVRIYNLHGRRDNKYKARIKILVKALGVEVFTKMVEDEWAHIRDSQTLLTDKEIKRAKSFFTEPDYQTFDGTAAWASINSIRSEDTSFAHWLDHNTHAHKIPGYRAVTLSLKPTGVAPGDITDSQLEAIADLAERFSFAEVRVTHYQNIVLADVEVQNCTRSGRN